MKRLLPFIFILSIFVAKAQTTASVSPESLGIPSQSILDFIDAAEKERPDDLHSFILMRHGQTAAQGWWNPYQPESPHMLFSLSKSFTSTAIGIAQAEGLLSINDKVISFFPDLAPKEPSKNLQAMRIRDLITMNTGHNDDATDRMRKDTSSWVRGFLSLNVEHKPGTHFVYNSAATFMLSAIIQKVTGKKLIDYLTPRLFEPLGIAHPTWETSPEGINSGGWGLKIRTRDIASFGQLYLQKGMWQGKQLVPAAWIEEATKKQTSNGSNPDSDWEQGYGYQFWMCRYGLYRGDGAFGQYCIVFPKQDAVLAITSGTKDMGAIMNLIWKHLLPAMKDQPLPENQASFAALQNKLGALNHTMIKGSITSPLISAINNRTYAINANDEGIEAVSFDVKSKNPSITFTQRGKQFIVPLGMAGKKTGIFYFPEEQAVATNGAWVAPDKLQARFTLYETPIYLTYDFTFNKEKINIKRTSNVNIGPATTQELQGAFK